MTFCVILGISYVHNVTILYSLCCIFMYMNSESWINSINQLIYDGQTGKCFKLYFCNIFYLCYVLDISYMAAVTLLVMGLVIKCIFSKYSKISTSVHTLDNVFEWNISVSVCLWISDLYLYRKPVQLCCYCQGNYTPLIRTVAIAARQLVT